VVPGFDQGQQAQAEILAEEAVQTAAIVGESLNRNRFTHRWHRVWGCRLRVCRRGRAMSTRKYIGMAGVCRATAQRKLANWVEKGLLRPNPGGGRSASYDVAWDEP
jgi:Fic family protein